MGKQWKQWETLLLGAPKSLQMVTAAMKLKDACPWKKIYDKPRQCIKKQRHHFAKKGPCSQSYGFSRSHEWIWELDHKEGWTLKNWRFWTVVLEKTLESPLDCKEIKLVNPKGNQPWIGRIQPLEGLGLKLKLHYFGHLMERRLPANDPDAGKDWGQEKWVTEDEMFEWHHWLNGHEFEQTPRGREGQGSLACCSPWDCKELDMI